MVRVRRELCPRSAAGDGLRNGQIVECLLASEKTVDRHVSAIVRRLGVCTHGEVGAEVRAARARRSKMGDACSQHGEALPMRVHARARRLIAMSDGGRSPGPRCRDTSSGGSFTRDRKSRVRGLRGAVPWGDRAKRRGRWVGSFVSERYAGAVWRLSRPDPAGGRQDRRSKRAACGADQV